MYRCIQYPYFTLLILPFLFSCYCRNFLNQNLHLLGGSLWGGGPTSFLPMEKCVFSHFFPMGKNGEKRIWKEREMNAFPFLSIYFFPIFPHGEKWENTFFHGQKWGWTPPPSLVYMWYENFLSVCEHYFIKTAKNFLLKCSLGYVQYNRNH